MQYDIVYIENIQTNPLKGTLTFSLEYIYQIFNLLLNLLYLC